MTPEQDARAEIDRLLTAAAWHECDYKAAVIHAARGAVNRNIRFVADRGAAANLLFVDGKAASIIEAERSPRE